jgi:hypothetical protein
MSKSPWGQKGKIEKGAIVRVKDKYVNTRDSSLCYNIMMNKEGHPNRFTVLQVLGAGKGYPPYGIRLVEIQERFGTHSYSISTFELV